ncbi:hypothetical protein HPP92_012538 [Vanilla planifolia]|uniref:Uncharacterized protein n=1 Tax=Vanilla planifolia TaxID=51239 RepID=A0A835R550_VANPL|nr:hypothetical protein HPP92_012538 [Vanilla planifolia]
MLSTKFLPATAPYVRAKHLQVLPVIHGFKCSLPCFSPQNSKFVDVPSPLLFFSLVEKDSFTAILWFWKAINAGDRVDSALKDMAVVMKQQDRAEEAIEAIKSFRHLCSKQAQESLDNLLLDLYKKCGMVGEQIELLKQKLMMICTGKPLMENPQRRLDLMAKSSNSQSNKKLRVFLRTWAGHTCNKKTIRQPKRCTAGLRRWNRMATRRATLGFA